MKKIFVFICIVLVFALSGCSQEVDENFINQLNYPVQDIRWGVKDIPQSYPKAPDGAQKIGDFYDYETIKEIVLKNKYLSEHFVLGESFGEGFITALNGDPVVMEMGLYKVVGVTKEHYEDDEYMTSTDSLGPEYDFEISVSSNVDNEGNQYFDIGLNMININDQNIQKEMYTLWEEIVGQEIAQTLVFDKQNSKESDDEFPLSYESTEKNSKLLTLSDNYKYQYVLERRISENTIMLDCALVHVNPNKTESNQSSKYVYSYDRLIDRSVQEIIKAKPMDMYPDLKINNINPEVPEDYFKELFEALDNKHPDARTYTTYFEAISIGEFKYDYRLSLVPCTIFRAIYKNDELVYRQVQASGVGGENDPHDAIDSMKDQLNLFFDLEKIEGLDIEKAFNDWINDARGFDNVENDDELGWYEQTVVRDGIEEKLTISISPDCIYKDGDVYMDRFDKELDYIELRLAFIYSKGEK